MGQFIAFAENVEVNGQTVLSVVEGMPVIRQQAIEILARYGIQDPQPGEWYSQQAWLNAFKEIAQTIGPNTLYQIGVKIPDNAQFPPDIDSLHKGLASIDIAYHMNHRGGEIGHYELGEVQERQAVIVCHNPYPCDFDRGIITAIGRRFGPPGTAIMVQHADVAQSGCRKLGHESCTYLITY